MKRRVALYARVSTDGQSEMNQLRELEAAAKQQGWQVIQQFVDKGISGAKGRDSRPAFDALCKGIVRRDFDMVAAWSVDRLGRSLLDLLTFLKEIHGRPRVSQEVEAEVLKLRRQGNGMRRIARELGIGNCTVQRIVNA